MEYDITGRANPCSRIFNTGSPFNVIAGQGARGVDEMVAHYQKLNAEEDERKIKALAAKEK